MILRIFFLLLPKKFQRKHFSNLLYLNNFFCNTIFDFKIITDEEIFFAVKHIKNTKATDSMGISSFLIKKCIYIFLPFLNYLFNKCLEECIFPEEFKLSIVIPVYKAGSKNEPSNFRPISILPTLSKIFEYVLFQQMKNYFDMNNFFAENQNGFRKGFNTFFTLLDFSDYIIKNFDKGLNVLGWFLDLKKAFDMVNHFILIKKLHIYYGFSDHAINFLQSYLFERFIKVKLNDSYSKICPIEYGVPQGSTLGPFLFIIFINDLFKCELKGDNLLKCFADDTVILTPLRGHFDINIFEYNFITISNWFYCNHLVLNNEKCVFINFFLKKDRLNGATEINIKNQTYKLVKSYKYLGIIFDSRLKFDKQYNKLIQKLFFFLKYFYKVKLFLSPSDMSLLYKSFLLPIFEYCIIIYIHFKKSKYIKVKNIISKLISFTSINSLDFSLNQRLYTLLETTCNKIFLQKCPSYIKFPNFQSNISTRFKCILPHFDRLIFKHSYPFYIPFFINNYIERLDEERGRIKFKKNTENEDFILKLFS